MGRPKNVIVTIMDLLFIVGTAKSSDVQFHVVFTFPKVNNIICSTQENNKLENYRKDSSTEYWRW